MKSNGKRSWLSIVVIAVLLLPAVSGGSEGQSNAQPWETVGLSAGYFISDVDTSLRLGAGLGVDIDLEDLLGLDSTNSVFRVGGLWRFTDNQRHRLDLSWFSLSRDSTLEILGDITFENDEGEEITIGAGTTVDSFFDLDIYQLSYSYSFFQDDRLDLAAGIGLYIMPIDLGLSTSGFVNERASANFTAPLPVLGLRMDVALTPRWYIRTGTQVFYLEYKNFTGSILSFAAAVEYKPWEHVGIGVGFDTLGINIEADGEDWPEIDLRGKVQFNYTGLQLYLRLFF
jgi:hypothetical protein